MSRECECPLAGWCERHRMDKSEHLFQKCKADERYRVLWDGLAAGMDISCNHDGPPGARKLEEPKEPGIFQKAFNFAKASAKHAMDGFTNLSTEEIQKRLQICNTSGPDGGPCEELTKEMNCAACGCPVLKKAAWRSENCPRGKWPAPPEPERKHGGRCGCG